MPPASRHSLPTTVEGWLAYIESLHPKSIEMGLTRVRAVADRLQLRLDFTVLTVGGTNGKGSTCAMLEHIYNAAGYRVGCYTSPHLLHYHERIRFNTTQITDATLCAAFAAVEQARGDIALTYFEMGTLAALWAFDQVELDVVILEVGLGGRLDAVNIVDADCAILINVDLDHMEYLGNTREAIGYEKAGIFRPAQISICGDVEPPKSVIDYARQNDIALKRLGVDYFIEPHADEAYYRDATGRLSVHALKLFGAYQWQNAANVIYAVRALSEQLPVKTEVMLDAISQTELAGRFQRWRSAPDVILDVAHNPHAALALRHNLQQLRQQPGRIFAVFSMLSDKDIASVVHILCDYIDLWAIAPIQHPRAASVSYLAECIQRASPSAQVEIYVDLPHALHGVEKGCQKNDKIIVFGSFFTVAAILDLSA